MRSLRVEDLEFIEQAPLRVSESATISAPPLRVFAAFADTRSWPQWFPLMHRCEWVSDQVECVGAERVVSLYGLGTYRERFLAWDPGVRFAFTMTESSSPLANAVAEDFRMSPVREGEATRIAWTLAADPSGLGKLLRPALEATMRRVFVESGKRLEARLNRR